MWVTVPPSPMETVQVVVPYERDGGKNHRGQWEVRQREPKEYIEVVVSVGVRCPGKDKDLDDVEYDGEEPREDAPTGEETTEGRVKIIIIGAQTLELDGI